MKPVTSAIVCLLLTAQILVCGCSSVGTNMGALTAMREKELSATSPAKADLMTSGAPGEKAAGEAFEKFYEVYSADVIRRGVRDLYAEDAYFGDPFKGVKGIDDIESYFVHMAEAVHDCRFAVEAVDVCGHEYYFRWNMRLVIKRDKKHPIIAPGVSHVRFRKDGKIVFQQDYWDLSLLMERLPISGGPTRFIKRRMDM
jgi:hypothetical protein